MAVPIVATSVVVLIIAGGLACSNGTPGQVEPTIGQTRQLTYLALGDSYTMATVSMSPTAGPSSSLSGSVRMGLSWPIPRS